MAKSKQPYVRFFVSDWLGGTRGMRASEIGIYITLLALMYDRESPLPEDHKRLARQCGCSPKAFSDTLEMLVDDGKIEKNQSGLWNKRVEKEFKWRAENSQNAREAAEKRWQKDNKNNTANMRPHSECNADGMPFQTPEVRSQKENNTRAINREFATEFWPLYPHKVGKADALKAYAVARRKVEKQTILDGVKRYVQSKPPDRNWCNPGTFLRQERWADEPANAAGDDEQMRLLNAL